MVKVITVFGVDTPPGAAVAHSLCKAGVKVRGVPLGDEIPIPPGVEVVRCDLRNASSFKDAAAGSDGCFVQTFSDFKAPDFVIKETEVGRRIADACESARVPHVIFSTQPHTLDLASLGARHMCVKAELEQYFCTKRIPMTFIILPIAYEELLYTIAPTKENSQGQFKLELPLGEDFPMDMICLEDIGPALMTIFTNPESFIVRDPVYPVKAAVALCGDKLLRREIADDLSHFLRPLRFRDVPVTNHQYRSPDGYDGVRKFPWSLDYGNMFQFLQRVRWDRNHDANFTRRLNPNLIGFQKWAEKNKEDLQSAYTKLPDAERLKWWFKRMYEQ